MLSPDAGSASIKDYVEEMAGAGSPLVARSALLHRRGKG